MALDSRFQNFYIHTQKTKVIHCMDRKKNKTHWTHLEYVISFELDKQLVEFITNQRLVNGNCHDRVTYVKGTTMEPGGHGEVALC